MNQLRILPKPLLYIFLAFILCTVIGTLSHEFGHFTVAKSLGYNATLSYQSVHWETKKQKDLLRKLADGHLEEIRNNKPFRGKEAFEAKRKKLQLQRLLIRLGGPLQTILTGTIGFTILIYRRKKHPLIFNTWNWVAVFLAFFWIRQPCNLVLSGADRILRGHGRWFGGDERKISLYLNIPPGTLSLITGIIGFIVVAYVVFYMIPKKYVLTFILAGLTGGLVGFTLWMDYLGPFLLP